MAEQSPQNILLFFRIMNQMRRLAHQTDSSPMPGGMSVSQFAALSYIALENQDIFQRDLETRFNLRRSTVSSLLDALERKDLIKRVSVKHDARLKKLVLTEKGRTFGTEIYDGFSRMEQIMLSGLSDEEQEELLHLLHRIEDNMIAAEK